MVQARNNFHESDDLHAQLRRVEEPKVVPAAMETSEVSATKIARAVRRIALVELGHLSEGRVRLPFAVVPNLTASPEGPNWRIHVSSLASVEARRALLHAEATLQPRWRLVDMFQDARALIV